MDHSGNSMHFNSPEPEETGFSFFGAFRAFTGIVSNVVNATISSVKTGIKRTYDDFLNRPASNSDLSSKFPIEEELGEAPVPERPLKKQKTVETLQDDMQEENISTIQSPILIDHLPDYQDDDSSVDYGYVLSPEELDKKTPVVKILQGDIQQQENISIVQGPTLNNNFEGLEFMVVEKNKDQEQPTFDDINDLIMSEESQSVEQDEEIVYDFGLNSAINFGLKRYAKDNNARKEHLQKQYNTNGMRSNLYRRK